MQKSLIFLAFATALFVPNVSAQTTTTTYQGSLNVAGGPATGNYDFELKLFDALVGGIQQGGTLQRLNVAVTNGIFTFPLDFGPAVLPGADRFLDIAVRAAGGGAFTPLAPRQLLTSSPYSVRSLNSTSSDRLGGIAAANYLQTNGNGSGLTNLNASSVNTGILAVGWGGTGVTASGATGNFLRSNGINWVSTAILPADLPAGLYIQNTTSPQASNFNITGNGTVGGTVSGNVVNAVSQYNLGGSAMIRQQAGGAQQNLYIGNSAGLSNNSVGNTFVGVAAGQNNTSYNNAFFGTRAGVGSGGTSNSSFFGYLAGEGATGEANSFFGSVAGYQTTGAFNSFFGTGAGSNNLGGQNNSFFGFGAGGEINAGSGNSAVGYYASVGPSDITNATALGANALVSASNSLVLGSINGVNNATADTRVGIGTTAPNASSKLHVNGNVRVTNGYVYITNPIAFIIISPNGACWGVSVNNIGALATVPVNPCP